MPAVEDVLTDLATHPPTDPTPVTAIRGRARRRARRRRVLVSAAAVLVVAAAGVGVTAAVTADDPGEEVMADGGTTSESSSSTTTTTPGPTTEVPVVTARPTMTLDPATGHEDGTVVTMALDEPATGPAIVAQCVAEALGDGSADVYPWCTGLTEMPAEALTPFTLSRTIDTPDGLVDCAEAVGRCTLDVRVGGEASSDDRHAPLAFREDLPPLLEPAAVVEGDEGTVGDGDTMLVTLTGVETGDVYTVMQCRTGPPTAEGDDLDGAQCSSARGRPVMVQDGPETQVTFTAFHDIFVNTAPAGGWAPGWVGCEPCELRITAESREAPITQLPLVMEPTASPIRPTIELDPAGPHAPGAEVTARLSGLQPATTVDVAWCVVRPPQGGGDSPCHYPGEGGSVPATVGEDGTAEVAGFGLPPDAVQGEDCRVTAGTCGVGIHDPAWFAYLAIAPLDLNG